MQPIAIYAEYMAYGSRLEKQVRDRRERFVALAEARTEKAIQNIRLIGNLSNKVNYEYTDADAAQILRALEAELKALKGRFSSDPAAKSPVFRLK